MSPLFEYFVALAVLLLSSDLARSKSTVRVKECSFNSTHFNATAFYLEANATRYLYPDVATGELSLDGDLRIACPSGSMIVAGSKKTKLPSSLVECMGGPLVKLSGTPFTATFNQLGCEPQPEPTIRLTGRTAGDGKRIIEIGYQFGKKQFLPVIDDLAVNSFSGGYIPRWAHFKALPPIVSVGDETSDKVALQSSRFTAKVNFDSVYDVMEQRKSFRSLFNDTALVDKYLPVDGEYSFVASQLVSRDDLYYENQRAAARYYETTVPVWKSVRSGNWKLAGEVVRRLAKRSLPNKLQVWSGTYLSLWLRDSQRRVTYVKLPEGLRPSQFLFKYVYDAKANKGIVILTVNNPHLMEADDRNVICEEIPACRKEYPQFREFARGYTYCCSLRDFEGQAKRLGLPVFADASVFDFDVNADEKVDVVTDADVEVNVEV